MCSYSSDSPLSQQNMITTTFLPFCAWHISLTTLNTLSRTENILYNHIFFLYFEPIEEYFFIHLCKTIQLDIGYYNYRNVCISISCAHWSYFRHISSQVSSFLLTRESRDGVWKQKTCRTVSTINQTFPSSPGSNGRHVLWSSSLTQSPPLSHSEAYYQIREENSLQHVSSHQ